MRLGDLDDLKVHISELLLVYRGEELDNAILNAIDNAPTVDETEKPFITESRKAAIEENLPLYFVYYEETGVFEVYITDTKELFEKRHCSKHLPYYKFKEIATDYLDWYLDWRARNEYKYLLDRNKTNFTSISTDSVRR